MSRPLSITAIVTTYNSGATIERCLRSVLNQQGAGDRFALDVVVVDDCSTDDTRERVARLPVRLLTTAANTGGPNAGRNIGLEVAGGDYLCVVDHDDEWKPDRVLRALPFLDGTPVVSSGYTLVDASRGVTEERGRRGGLHASLRFEAGETFRSLLARRKGGQSIYLGSLFVHRSRRAVRFEEHFGVVDYDWLLRLFEGAASAEICQSLYVRHVSGANLSLDRRYRTIDFHYSLLTLDGYRDRYPDAVERGYRRVYGTRARYHYLMGEMREARFFLRHAGLSLKNVLYGVTSFGGHEWVRRRFTVFG